MKKYYIFDETVIDDGKTLFKSIRERRSSEHGIKHVIQASESTLSSGIPFSMADSTTPFRVFILRNEKKEKDEDCVDILTPSMETGICM